MLVRPQARWARVGVLVKKFRIPSTDLSPMVRRGRLFASIFRRGCPQQSGGMTKW